MVYWLGVEQLPPVQPLSCRDKAHDHRLVLAGTVRQVCNHLHLAAGVYELVQLN